MLFQTFLGKQRIEVAPESSQMVRQCALVYAKAFMHKEENETALL